jgi:hypothetical protein
MARKKFTSLAPTTARRLGAAAIVAGSVLLWDGYEGSGKDRPFWVKLLPGA